MAANSTFKKRVDFKSQPQLGVILFQPSGSKQILRKNRMEGQNDKFKRVPAIWQNPSVFIQPIF
jgi:hypothetical protein